MEITGSGQPSKTDELVDLFYSYHYMLKNILALSLLATLLACFMTSYYVETTYLKEYFSWFYSADKKALWTEYGLFLSIVFLGSLILFLSASFLVSLYRLRTKHKGLAKVVIEPIGIKLVSQSSNLEVQKTIDWKDVRKIKVKKYYLHIYTSSRTNFHIIVPTRYFHHDQLSDSIQQIRKLSEGSHI